MTELQQIIHQALVRHRGIRRRRAWLAAFAAFAAVMVLTAVFDRMWMFSGGLRWIGWIIGVVTAAFAARWAMGAACTDATTVSMSSGERQRKSITSVETPCDCSTSAAPSASCTSFE